MSKFITKNINTIKIFTLIFNKNLMNYSFIEKKLYTRLI